MQTKRHSAIEALTNTFAGLLLSFGLSQLFCICEKQIQHFIWSGFVWHISTGSNIVVTLVLTVVSIVRGYILRRAFNRRTVYLPDLEAEHIRQWAVKNLYKKDSGLSVDPNYWKIRSHKGTGE